MWAQSLPEALLWAQGLPTAEPRCCPYFYMTPSLAEEPQIQGSQCDFSSARAGDVEVDFRHCAGYASHSALISVSAPCLPQIVISARERGLNSEARDCE